MAKLAPRPSHVAPRGYGRPGHTRISLGRLYPVPKTHGTSVEPGPPWALRNADGSRPPLAACYPIKLRGAAWHSSCYGSPIASRLPEGDSA